MVDAITIDTIAVDMDIVVRVGDRHVGVVDKPHYPRQSGQHEHPGPCQGSVRPQTAMDDWERKWRVKTANSSQGYAADSVCPASSRAAVLANLR